MNAAPHNTPSARTSTQSRIQRPIATSGPLPSNQLVRRAGLSLWLIAACLVALSILSGCAPEPKPIAFEPNLVHAMKYQIKEGMPMEQASEDAFWIVTEMFGTPEDPKLPAIVTEDEDLAQVVSVDNLKRASGRIGESGRGLYQTHCVTCHGVTGNGRGELSSTMSPYPRDYRKGVFKFKSTDRGEKPTREDLAKLIKNGINGSRMVAIPNLTDEDVQALVDYVIYLSWRGELERSLIDDAVYELDLESGDRVINPNDRNSTDEELKETFDDSWELAEDFALEIGEAWMEAPDAVVEVPEAPEGIIVTNSHEEFVQIANSDQADELAKSVARGAMLFKGKIASCSKCHGEKGLGDGQNTDYDDWTKEWTIGIGIKPENRDELVSLMARGALPPINAQPRNFQQGAFHGGSTAADLFRRITIGIEGSPMPAVTFVDGEFEEEDVWHLINFIRSLQTAEPAEGASPTPAAKPDAAQSVSL
ncbi:Cytochrome C oxidase, cbb3-type, subunit III [Neorhodopirellula lusitana]|uniref:Cytochrome C oxidase, cbb3-type, subunit III n=1 Tax=Neorhodopirellula lusitana TaxID=445327 RepID=A0ABY1PNI8_9BACT|nr:c-type cytochrome [Neorhodopirellula lusitana]SMP39490.1 Cytochrome C oxidase, cbb3-type, subunit III [Neorhodopirellula lusitana]